MEGKLATRITDGAITMKSRERRSDVRTVSRSRYMVVLCAFESVENSSFFGLKKSRIGLNLLDQRPPGLDTVSTRLRRELSTSTSS